MAPKRKFDIKFKEKVLKFAEEHSGEKAAKQFVIDPRQIRYWKNEFNAAKKTRARLAGASGGRRKVDMETSLVKWIFSVHDKHNRVSRKIIKNKALESFSSLTVGGDHNFVVTLTLHIKRYAINFLFSIGKDLQ